MLQACTTIDAAEHADRAVHGLISGVHGSSQEPGAALNDLLDRYEDEGPDLLEPRRHPVVLGDLQPIDCDRRLVEELVVSDQQRRILDGAFEEYDRTFVDSPDKPDGTGMRAMALRNHVHDAGIDPAGDM